MGIFRTLLALSVLISHSGPFLGFNGVGGLVAVESFYIISGFYMSLVLKNKYIGSSSYSTFITNRFLRLFPIYWIVIFATMAYRDEYFYFFTQIAGFNWVSDLFVKFANVFLFFQDWIMFMGIDMTTGKLFFTSNFMLTEPKLYTYLFAPQAWTLGVELTFYLVAPFLLRLRFRWILLLMLLSGIFRAIVYWKGFKHDPWTDRFFPFELFYFLAGRVAYEGYRRWVKGKTAKIPMYLATFLLLLLTWFFSEVPFASKKYLFYFAVTICLPFCFELFKKSGWDRWIGELSYPIYICHALVIQVVAEKWGHVPMVTAVVTLAVATLLNLAVAAPLEKIRQRRALRAST